MVKVDVKPLWYRRLAVMHYQRGLALLQSMAYSQAIAAFEKAMHWHPIPCEVLVMRGVAYAKLGQMAAAFADYNQALIINPKQSRAYAKRGLLHDSQGNHEQALKDWEQAISLGNKDAEIYYRKGLKALNTAQEQVALTAFDQALEFNPNYAEAYFQRGNLHQQLGDIDAAMADWELAIFNDLGQDIAKVKLHQAQEQIANATLNDQLQDFFKNHPDLKVFQVQARHVIQRQDSYLELLVERPLGVGVNYQTLPNIIRQGLVELELEDVYQFELLGRVVGTRFQDWKKRYGIYDQQPCPPCHWRLVWLMVVACPPVGLSALICNTQVIKLYEQGKYPLAKQASQLIHGLCRLGIGLSGSVLLIVLLSAVFGPGRSPASLKQQTSTEQTSTDSAAKLSEYEQCLERESKARCMGYRKQKPDAQTGP